MHVTNRLLAQLPGKVLRELAPQLVSVDLEKGQALHSPGETWQVYFPLRCVVSVLIDVDTSRSLEVALVGREGLAGFPLMRGSRRPFSTVVQSSGAALRLAGSQLVTAMRVQPALNAAVHEHAASLIEQIATNAGCNHFHQLEQRLARRLLMARHRAGTATFQLTQEFLATLLAVRRVGVSEAASSLQRQGLIEYHRGEMTILDEAGLNRAACECSRGELGTAPHRRGA
jgi:CRP-like cAMP-binding protein